MLPFEDIVGFVKEKLQKKESSYLIVFFFFFFLNKKKKNYFYKFILTDIPINQQCLADKGISRWL
jgi:hypothetical protein